MQVGAIVDGGMCWYVGQGRVVAWAFGQWLRSMLFRQDVPSEILQTISFSFALLVMPRAPQAAL